MPKSAGEKTESLIPFEDVAGNPEAWQEVAHDLVGCANILLKALRVREQSDGADEHACTGAFWRVPMMLYGLAAENLIKAIIVARRPTSDVTFPLAKGSFPGWFKNHDLCALAKRAGLRVSGSQEHLLKRLKVFVECGKYPLGLREEQDRAAWVSFGALDWNDVFQLLEYLEEELQKASGDCVSAHPDLRGIHRAGARREPSGYG